MGTIEKVGFLSFCFSGLLVSIVLTLLHLLGGCCPAQGVDLLFVCCGLRRIESNRDALSPNRFVLWGEVVCSLLTLLQLAPGFPRISMSLLSFLGGLLWLL